MKERSVERIPPELEEWIAAGKPVRDDPTMPFAGMCGARVIRPNGSQNGGAWCQRAAGWATEHSGYGRCIHHEKLLDEDGALPPWVGELTDDEWIALVGAKSAEARHGAKYILRIRRSWEQWLAESLDPEELYAFQTMTTDPVTLLDQEIKLNRLAMGRIQRWLRQQRMVMDMDPVQIGGTARSLEVQQAENQLMKLAMTFARLMEVRARISEAATGERAQTVIEDMLRGMSDEEFAAISAQPDRFMLSLNQGANRGRGIGESD